MILSQEEKDFINRMNDPVYKLSVVEGWLNYPLTNADSDMPLALQKSMIEGFVKAVKIMVKLEKKSRKD